jgi:hypothetical protein
MLNIIYLNSYDRVKYSRETIMDGAEGERATRNSQAKGLNVDDTLENRNVPKK